MSTPSDEHPPEEVGADREWQVGTLPRNETLSKVLVALWPPFDEVPVVAHTKNMHSNLEKQVSVVRSHLDNGLLQMIQEVNALCKYAREGKLDHSYQPYMTRYQDTLRRAEADVIDLKNQYDQFAKEAAKLLASPTELTEIVQKGDTNRSVESVIKGIRHLHNDEGNPWRLTYLSANDGDVGPILWFAGAPVRLAARDVVVECGPYAVSITRRSDSASAAGMRLTTAVSGPGGRYRTGGYVHPACEHRRSPCFGSAQSEYINICSTGDVVGVLDMLTTLLYSYNEAGGPYQSLPGLASRSEYVKCRKCGAYLSIWSPRLVEGGLSTKSESKKALCVECAGLSKVYHSGFDQAPQKGGFADSPAEETT